MPKSAVASADDNASAEDDASAEDGASVDGASVAGASVDGASVDGASVAGACVASAVVAVVSSSSSPPHAARTSDPAKSTAASFRYLLMYPPRVLISRTSCQGETVLY